MWTFQSHIARALKVLYDATVHKARGANTRNVVTYSFFDEKNEL